MLNLTLLDARARARPLAAASVAGQVSDRSQRAGRTCVVSELAATRSGSEPFPVARDASCAQPVIADVRVARPARAGDALSVEVERAGTAHCCSELGLAERGLFEETSPAARAN